MRCDLSGPQGFITRLSLVWALAAAWCLVAPSSAILGGEDEPTEASPEEPQALLSPVELLPITPPQAAPATPSGPEFTGPSVKLAPEINVLMDPRARLSADLTAIKPANFKDVTPGETARESVLEKLGEPIDSQEQDGAEVLTFAIGPFPQVRVTLDEGVVSSIVIHLAGPSARGEVAQELGLSDLHSVVVRDDQDRPLGEVYPERGLMFAYADGVRDAQEAAVEHVILETISAEPFVLRAQQLPADDYGRRLADLETAGRLDPEDPVAFGMAARLELECGRPSSALAAAQKAVKLDLESVEYRLTLADAQRQLGQSHAALDATRGVLREPDLSPADEARARFILGRLLATTAPRNYRQAMDETVAAIKLAAAQVNRGAGELRGPMRQLLIEAELSLSEILAYGPWKQKHTVIPQWLVTAEKAANEYIEQDGGSRRALLSVYSTSLHCLLVLDGQGTPDQIAEAAIELGRDLLTAAEDDDYQAAIEWQLGTALRYAAQVAHRKGDPAAALQYANNAEALLASSVKQRTESPAAAHQLAQTRFLIGSIHAIDQHDDATAVRWYDRALPQLRTMFPDSLLDERGLMGEQLVSVGISLWEAGRRTTAISVTEEGAELIAQAVREGAIEKSTLSVPYQNLAEMHRQLGNAEKADRLAGKAAEADPKAAGAVQRR